MEQFSPLIYHPSSFHCLTDHISRRIKKSNNRDIERIAKPDKARAFFSGFDIYYAAQLLWLISYHANGMATQPGESGYHAFCKVWFHFKEIAIIKNRANNIMHGKKICALMDLAAESLVLEWNLRLIRHNPVQRFITSVGVVVRRVPGRFFAPIGRQEIHQSPGLL